MTTNIFARKTLAFFSVSWQLRAKHLRAKPWFASKFRHSEKLVEVAILPHFAEKGGKKDLGFMFVRCTVFQQIPVRYGHSSAYQKLTPKIFR